MGKKKLAIIYGGKSAEHDVSVKSTKNIVNAVDKKRYQITLIKIARSGTLSQSFIKELNRHDVIFPVLHGPYGEDGTMQGLLKLIGKPFVGADVLGSAVGMDKDVMKRLLRDAGIPTARFAAFKRADQPSYGVLAGQLGKPFFIKPANLGSSIGISKVRNRGEFDAALKLAFQHDRKVLAEEYVRGRELECSVIGNDQPVASLPGEIVVNDVFYTFEAKYLKKNASILMIPAKLPAAQTRKVQALAIKVFQTLECVGMARIDFFLTPKGKLIVNEINTIPGFTDQSMYPKLWEASGIGHQKLIDRLIELAIKRFEKAPKSRKFE